MSTRWTAATRVLSLTAALGAFLVFLGTAAGGSQPARVLGSMAGSQLVSRDGSQIPPGATVVPGRVVVRFRTGVALSARSDAVAQVDASVATTYHLVPGLEVLRLQAGTSVASAVAALSRDPRVEYAVPDLMVKVATTTPNDPMYSSQWALAAIGAPQAWDRTTGSPSVKVAVLDSGVQLDHPDLTANLIPGWNFLAYTNSTVPVDDNGHGTIVSGIIGAAGDNGVGMTGVNWHVSLMPLKICTDFGSCDLTAAASAIQYAVDHGAKIINGSYGGWESGGYKPEQDAIAAASKAGVLFVAAAGNGALDNAARPFYPASYPLDNIISVGATTPSGGVASFSDYGDSVEIGAPGYSVLSTTIFSGPDSNPSGYDVWSGTSVSAPIVTGAAALLWAEHPDWTMQQVRMRLLTTATPLLSPGGKLCDQVNVDAATDPAVPDRALVCVSLSGTGNGTVTSDPSAVDCGSSCGDSVPAGTTVTLTATPASGSTFAGWKGACTGLGSCSINATGLMRVRATFNTSGSPPGWQQTRLSAPAGRDPYPPSATPDWSSYNVAVSANGIERAKTFATVGGPCGSAPDDVGVFLERRTAAGWGADGQVNKVSLPAFAGDYGAGWANCSNFGTVTQFSADGSTLLISADEGFTGDSFRCAAWVYQRGSGGWALDTVLFPPGVDAHGSPDPNVCAYFGIGGAISGDGSRIAMLTGGSDGSGAPVLRADIYSDAEGPWSLEQQITLPSPNSDCGHGIAPGYLSLSGDGATLLVGDPSCDDAGVIAAGLVFAYTRSGAQWTLAQTIHPPTPTLRQEFGAQTALSEDGNTAVIGTFATDANHSWVFERDESGWHMSALLPNSGASTTSGNTMNCPTIVQDGARIICGASYDDVSFNSQQGAILIFDRPAAGWASAPPQAAEAFATGGLGSDQLGQRIAAPENGSFIDATISMYGVASGSYPHDRIGYEFTTGALDKTLSVHTSGGGFGSVSSNLAGISCGSICAHDYPDRTSVTLTATPKIGSAFAGWTGGGCSGTGTCLVTMSQDQSVTATFVVRSQALKVSKAGAGGGTVSSSPIGISCGSTCGHAYPNGTAVTLTARPGAGSVFAGWSGSCTGTSPTCHLSMTAARATTATFAVARVLTVYKLGTGSGRVTSVPAGISCTATCSHAFASGAVVTLTAVAKSGSTFTGWSGACSGTGKCVVKMSSARSVRATFKLNTGGRHAISHRGLRRR